MVNTLIFVLSSLNLNVSFGVSLDGLVFFVGFLGLVEDLLFSFSESDNSFPFPLMSFKEFVSSWDLEDPCLELGPKLVLGPNLDREPNLGLGPNLGRGPKLG